MVVTEQVEHLIEALAAENPHVRSELDRQEPPPRATPRMKLLKPPASIRLTIALAGAAAVKPGIHYIHFYSPSVEIRPEILRMAADLSRQPSPPIVHVFSRHRRALLAALGSALDTEEEWAEVSERIKVYSRSEALRHVTLAKDAHHLFIIDLDDLAKGIRYQDIASSHHSGPARTVLLIGSREHPLLPAYRQDAAKHADWLQWGVSREMIRVLDARSLEPAMAALAYLNPDHYDKLPARFADVERDRVIPPQLRTIPIHERRIWCTIAGFYGLESAVRRAAITREVIPVEDAIPQVLLEAASRVRALNNRMKQGLVVSLELARAVDDLAYYANLPGWLSIPVGTYAKQLGPSPVTRLSKPVDRLVEIAEFCLQSRADRDDVSAEVRDVALTLEKYYSDDQNLRAVPTRTAKIVELMNTTLDAGDAFTLITLNRPEATAAEGYFSSRIKENAASGASRSERRRLFSIVDARSFSASETSGIVVVARPPPADLVERVLEAPITKLVAVVPHEVKAKAEIRLSFDSYREEVLLGASERTRAMERLTPAARRVTVELPAPAVRRFPRELQEDPAADPDRSTQATRADVSDEEEESLLEAILEQRDNPSEAAPHAQLTADTPPRRVLLSTAHVLVEYEDGSRELLANDDVLLRVEENQTEPTPVRVDSVRSGDLLLTTNSAWGSTRLADIVVDLLTKYDTSLNAIDFLDRAWRSAITKRKETDTWEEILDAAQAHGYDNITALSILFYAKRAVWLPKKKTNLSAVLAAVSPHELGRPEVVEQIWTGTSRLKSLAARVLRYAKDAAKRQRSTWDDEMADPLILEEVGLRKSHLDGLFELRRVKQVTYAAAGTELEI